MIDIENLNKTFGKFRALSDVSAHFKRGECIALIGPNGSGKTTLIKCMLGMVIADSGVIKVDESDIRNTWDFRKNIGYMPQSGRYPEHMTVAGMFDMMRDIRQVDNEDDDLYREFKIKDILGKRLGNLSGGMKQKVNASLAFLFNPYALILDEPTAGLDPVASEILKDKIRIEKERGKLILITSHILSDLEELVSEITYLQDGKVFFRKTIGDLKNETGENTLARALASIMKQWY